MAAPLRYECGGGQPRRSGTGGGGYPPRVGVYSSPEESQRPVSSGTMITSPFVGWCNRGNSPSDLDALGDPRLAGCCDGGESR